MAHGLVCYCPKAWKSQHAQQANKGPMLQHIQLMGSVEERLQGLTRDISTTALNHLKSIAFVSQFTWDIMGLNADWMQSEA